MSAPAERRPCSPTCAACWMEAHEGHDVGTRHEDGKLRSATCRDCGASYERVGPIEGVPDA